MDKKLFVELFRFNHKTDYLPYYKKYEIKYKESENILDLLKKIDGKEEFSYNGVEEHGLKINGFFLSPRELISDVVEKSSDTFIIEPVSTYRALNDLSINNDDFFKKMGILDRYLSKKQKGDYSKELQLEYYASNSLNFNKGYMGDHVMIMAADIIESDGELKDELLKLLDDKECGIRFYTSSKKRLFSPKGENSAKIIGLLQEVTKIDQEENLDDIIHADKMVQEFIEFNIAVYDSNDTEQLKQIVTSSKAKYVDIESKNDDLAFYSIDADKSFSYKIAGNILLEAKDNNADFLVVNCQKSFDLFDTKQKEIACTIGREINLPIVTADQFSDMLAGEKDPLKLGFDEHKVAIPFL